MRPDMKRLTAPNPGPMTLEGTNTYLVGRDPAVVIDPGPADKGHIEAVRRAADARGGTGTVLLTHDDADHLAGVELLGIEPARPADGETVAGLTAIATPGHAAEHLSFLLPDGHRSTRRRRCDAAHRALRLEDAYVEARRREQRRRGRRP